MVERLVRNYDENFNEIESYLNNLNLNDLINLYLKCATPLYIQNYENISKILNLVFDNIMNKLDTVSLIDIINLYSNIFVETMSLEDSIQSNQNIINVREFNLTDDFFLEYESKKKDQTKEEYIKDYFKSLENYRKSLAHFNKCFQYLDKLQKSVLSYIDSALKTISNEENEVLLREINKKIEETSDEILRRYQLSRNKKAIDIESRMKETPSFEIFNMLDTIALSRKDYVYSNYQAALMEKYVGKDKK